MGHGLSTRACVTHTAHTRACMLGVCVLQSSSLLLYTGHTRACVPYTVHTRACMLSVCPFVSLCSLYTVHTRACVGRVSHTRSIHGRVCWACVLVFSPDLIHGLSTRACVPAVYFPSFPKLTFCFPLTSIRFVLGFLSSNCVQIFYKPS